MAHYIAGYGLGYGPGLGFLSCTEVGSRDLSPSLCNVNMFCIVQCKYWVWNRSPSPYAVLLQQCKWVIMVYSHCSTPEIDKNGSHRTVWKCLHYTETDINTHSYWVLYLFYRSWTLSWCRAVLTHHYGSFTLLETDSGTNSDSDSEQNGYIVLYRICSNCTGSDSDPYSLLLYRTGIWVCIRIRVLLRKCIWIIRKFIKCSIGSIPIK